MKAGAGSWGAVILVLTRLSFWVETFASFMFIPPSEYGIPDFLEVSGKVPCLNLCYVWIFPMCYIVSHINYVWSKKIVEKSVIATGHHEPSETFHEFASYFLRNSPKSHSAF